MQAVPTMTLKRGLEKVRCELRNIKTRQHGSTLGKPEGKMADVEKLAQEGVDMRRTIRDAVKVCDTSRHQRRVESESAHFVPQLGKVQTFKTSKLSCKCN